MRTLSPTVVWHDLECGRYAADLPLWRSLASRHDGPVLEIGAGTGRVSIELLAGGHRVTALDHDEDLLVELVRRAEQTLPGAADGHLRAEVSDAREFWLEEQFGLIAAPMQTIQLLGGDDARASFLRCAARHLRRGGRLAVAITERFDLYDGRGRDGSMLPPPDVQESAGTVYVSQPTAVRAQGTAVVLDRRREILSADGARLVELHQERLDRLTARRLEREGEAAGLRPAGRAHIPATEDHVGSVVVMLDA